mgnify:CR=1 FL=1
MRTTLLEYLSIQYEARDTSVNPACNATLRTALTPSVINRHCTAGRGETPDHGQIGGVGEFKIAERVVDICIYGMEGFAAASAPSKYGHIYGDGSALQVWGPHMAVF